jgi:hypothetical protein
LKTWRFCLSSCEPFSSRKFSSLNATRQVGRKKDSGKASLFCRGVALERQTFAPCTRTTLKFLLRYLQDSVRYRELLFFVPATMLQSVSETSPPVSMFTGRRCGSTLTVPHCVPANVFLSIRLSQHKSVAVFRFAECRHHTFVGAIGFEPTTSCSQSKRASRTAPRPDD